MTERESVETAMGLIDSKGRTHIFDPETTQAWIRAETSTELEEAR
jgi:hypothetical protein